VRISRWNLYKMLSCFSGALQSTVTTSISCLEKSAFTLKDEPWSRRVVNRRMIGDVLNSYEKLKPARNTGSSRKNSRPLTKDLWKSIVLREVLVRQERVADTTFS
jgi:hypothetical protein